MMMDSTQGHLDPESQLLPRTRPELTATQQIYDGEPYWVVKDPVALRYYRFNREEYFIIDQLRRGLTLDELKAAHRREFRTDRLSNAEISQFIRDLASKSIVMIQHPRRDELLFQAGRRQYRNKLLGTLTNLMFVKIPLYDPDRLFGRLERWVRFFWTKTFLLLYLVLLAVAGLMVVRRWNAFTDMFQSHFLTIYNLPLLLVTIYLIKGLHEFGHGLTCKHYGGEVHEVGFLFLVFNPFFYCNVTDSWTFPDKARRLLVTAGGIMTELLFAALGVIGWYYTDPPGFFNQLCFNVAIACSLSTVLLNANPLLRYDGYYMLMDLIEIPNLRQRASKYLRQLFVQYVLGGDTGELPEEHRYRTFFPVYALGAFVYRWFIMFMILFAVYHLLSEVHLEAFARVLVVFTAVTMMVLPLVKGTTDIVRRRRAMGISHVRLTALLALLVAGAAVALFWPMQQHVTLNFVVEPTRMAWLRAEVPGVLHLEPGVADGVWVGDADGPRVLARLESPELRFETRRLEAELEGLAVEVDHYRQLGMTNRVERLLERQEALRAQHQTYRELLAKCEIVAPFEAEVLAPVDLMERSEGRFIEPGTGLFLLADTRALDAKIWVPEKIWARIFKRADELGQNAELLLYAFSDQPFRGRVAAVSRHREDDMGEFGEKLALSNKVGGEVLTEYDPVTEQERPVEAVYEVTIAVDAAGVPDSVRPYMSGRARIDCGRSTLYQWGRDSLLRFISPDVRL